MCLVKNQQDTSQVINITCMFHSLLVTQFYSANISCVWRSPRRKSPNPVGKFGILEPEAQCTQMLMNTFTIHLHCTFIANQQDWPLALTSLPHGLPFWESKLHASSRKCAPHGNTQGEIQPPKWNSQDCLRGAEPPTFESCNQRDCVEQNQGDR